MTKLKKLEHLLETGRLTRREFMGRAAALGIGTALASTLAGRALQAAMPKKGGKLRVGTAGGSTTGSRSALAADLESSPRWWLIEATTSLASNVLPL